MISGGKGRAKQSSIFKVLVLKIDILKQRKIGENYVNNKTK